jgi:hypothetical protein
MGSSSATVEVLTAEVRVLMVGSRQVTLSVYGQLDVVPLSVMTPFGRVRLRGDTQWRDEYGHLKIRVVGADRDGRLCASWMDDCEYGHGYRYSDPGGDWRGDQELAELAWRHLADLPLIVLAGLR